jgi:hypothetical protein
VNDGSDRCRTVSRLRPAVGFASLTLIALPTLPLIAGKIGSLTPFSNADDRWAGLGGGCRASIGLCFLPLGRTLAGTHLAIVGGDLLSGRVGLVAMALGLGFNLLAVLLIYILVRPLSPICEPSTVSF